MQAAAVRDLMRRRGSVVGWYHATAPDPSSLNKFTGQPEASLGIPVKGGPFGESFPTDPVNIRAYISNKYYAPRMFPYGNVELGELQMTLPLPFTPEIWNGIKPLTAALLDAYTNGNFAFTNTVNAVYSEQGTTMVYDRFNWGGKIYMAKGRPAPLVDQNITFAWRLPITEWSV